MSVSAAYSGPRPLYADIGAPATGQTFAVNAPSPALPTPPADEEDIDLKTFSFYMSFLVSEGWPSPTVEELTTPPGGVLCVATPPGGVQCVATPPGVVQCAATPPSGVQCVATPPSGVQCAATPPSGVQCADTPPSGDQCAALTEHNLREHGMYTCCMLSPSTRQHMCFYDFKMV
jgi:hypothetical protein